MVEYVSMVYIDEFRSPYSSTVVKRYIDQLKRLLAMTVLVNIMSKEYECCVHASWCGCLSNIMGLSVLMLAM